MKRIYALLPVLLLVSCSTSNFYQGRFKSPISIVASADEEIVINATIDKYNSNSEEIIDCSTSSKKDFSTVQNDISSFSIYSSSVLSKKEYKIDEAEPLSQEYLKRIKNNTVNSVNYDEDNIFPASIIPELILYYDDRYLNDQDITSIESIISKADKLDKKFNLNISNSVVTCAFLLAKENSLSFTYDNDGKAIYETSLDDKESVSIVSYLSNLFNTNSDTCFDFINDVFETSSDGETIAFIGSTAYYSDLKKVHPHFKAAKLPSFIVSNKTYNMKSLSYTYGFYVNKNKTLEEKESAMALASLLIDEESQLTRYEKTGLIPVNKSALKNDRFTSKASDLDFAIQELVEHSNFIDEKCIGERGYEVIRNIGVHIRDNDVSDWSSFLKTQMDILRGRN